ncbi:glycosyltransferase family 4 protein [Rhizobium glycinendophyticum]|uniref:Glycosyltransferase family 4 protein n=1 Tax=Rhizobium glycinendophyticum TaxID=2589807 RepID=A0A504U8S6_9HYPH|nr:glycosyltransferase family 4 protein [Rhizobium glycinendophyticum]TPP11564.1 glycosyltransferase family 4 protein [Rhizobium glycinendophyticum]
MAKSETTYVDPAGVHVIAPNFKIRLSGVTSTIIQLVPVQNRLGQKVAVLGPGLPGHLPHLRYRDLWKLWKRPAGAAHRVWHARRNIEMLPGIIMRDVMRMPLKLVFTSASQRKHSGWTKFLIRQMDAVIATSAKTSAYLEVPNTVIMHGIDCEKFKPAEDKAAAKRACGLDPEQRYIGCFGRVRHQKGTDLFVDTMIAVLPQHPGWAAIVAGRATPQHHAFEEELKARVTTAGLADRILFVGEHKNIADWYRTLDLFIAPQRWEGFGLTPLEAMATGVPVVATDVGAFAELIAAGESTAGRVIARDDLPAMLKATTDMMSGATGPVIAEDCRNHVFENFRIETEASRLGALYGRPD